MEQAKIGRNALLRPVAVRALFERYKVEFALFMLVVVAIGPLIHPYRAQQASRYVLTAALWEDQSIQLDRFAQPGTSVLGIDRAVRDGHIYSDKAPLQPFLAVPLYATYRAVGGEPASEWRQDENLGLWWITFWMATIPAALLAVIIYRLARRRSPSRSIVATLSLFFGSLLLPFAALLFGHELGALLVLAAFALLTGDEPSDGRLLAAGALIGAAVSSEYTAGVAAVTFTLFALWTVRARAVWYLAGGVPFAAFLGWYHALAFGSPLNHPYRYSAFDEVTPVAREFFGNFYGFDFSRLVQVFLSGRGFLFATPIVLIGLVGLFALARRKGAQRRSAILALVTFGGFLLIPVFWSNPWGGWSPGARYMTPAFPLLIGGVVYMWEKLPVLARPAAVIGALTMILATITDPLLAADIRVSIGSWLRLAFDGEFVPTLFTMALGPFGWVMHAVLMGVVASVLAIAAKRSAPVMAADIPT